jgi:CxxC-x17-CxxC domain-containing protein
MEFQDKSLVCSDCGQEFVFTAGEQSFYQEKGFSHEPKRCKTCRARKKGGEGGGRGGQSDYGDPNSSGGRAGGYGGGGYGAGRSSGGGGGRGGAEVFNATCSSCGGPARLSFKPAPDRPVFCRTCYQSRSGMGGAR